jgi:hypothetical protein
MFHRRRIVLVTCLGVVASLVSACDSGLCGNEVQFQVKAPDGLHHAVVFQRDCGATTGFSTQISVLKGPGPTATKDLPNRPGNAYVADTNKDASPAAPWGGPAVDLSWLSATRLVIKSHPATRVFTKPSTINGVDVIYDNGVSVAPGG